MHLLVYLLLGSIRFPTDKIIYKTKQIINIWSSKVISENLRCLIKQFYAYPQWNTYVMLSHILEIALKRENKKREERFSFFFFPFIWSPIKKNMLKDLINDTQKEGYAWVELISESFLYHVHIYVLMSIT